MGTRSGAATPEQHGIDPERAKSPRLNPVDPHLIEELEAASLSLGLRATDRLAAAHDASHYLLTPQVVVTARDADEVGAAIAVGRRTGVPVTFLSGGTSLSGQSVSDGILIDTRQHFRGIEVLDGGDRVRCGPGATVRAVNARLIRRFRKLGSDPASEIACTIGGVVAINSSGMSCGTHANRGTRPSCGSCARSSSTTASRRAPLTACAKQHALSSSTPATSSVGCARRTRAASWRRAGSSPPSTGVRSARWEARH